MKTWKREVAGGMLATVFGMALHAHFNPESIEMRLPLLTLMFIPTLAFAAGAFGVDAWFKQKPRGGPDDRMAP